MRARSTRAAALLLAAALVPAWILGCDDTDDRRKKAILEVRGADSAAADHGAAELEKILQKSPSDRAALYALAMHYQRQGRRIDAQHLLERIAVAAPNSEEAAIAREQLTALARDAASSSARALPPLAPLPAMSILPGKGIAPVLVGMPAASASASLGPCELSTRGPDDTSLCHYFSRGIITLSKDGVVKDVVLVREHRELYDNGARHPYRGFVGQTPDGVSVGMPEASASARLGPPSARRLPLSGRIGEDGAIPVEVLDYPKKGMSIEIDLTRGGRVVGAIGVPAMEGRPRPTTKEDKP